MTTQNKKHPVISAISGIQTIKDVADAAGIALDEELSPESLSLWSSITEGLYECMDGEAMGIMFALIVDIAYNGYTLNDIKSMQVNQSGDGFSLKVFFKDESDCTATFH